MLPGVIDTSLSPATACAWASALCRPSVTKVNGASGNGQSAGGRWVTTKTASPTAGRPFQPLVRSNRRRPITSAPMVDHAARRYRALAGDVRKTRSGSAPVTWTFPLSYQSNSGPTWSFVSAMKPSSDMEAWEITFPISAPFLIFQGWLSWPAAGRARRGERRVAGCRPCPACAVAGEGHLADKMPDPPHPVGGCPWGFRRGPVPSGLQISRVGPGNPWALLRCSSAAAQQLILRQGPQPLGMFRVQGVGQIVAVGWIVVMGPGCGDGAVLDVLAADAVQLRRHCRPDGGGCALSGSFPSGRYGRVPASGCDVLAGHVALQARSDSAWHHRVACDAEVAIASGHRGGEQRARRLGLPVRLPRVVGTAAVVEVIEMNVATPMCS